MSQVITGNWQLAMASFPIGRSCEALKLNMFSVSLGLLLTWREQEQADAQQSRSSTFCFRSVLQHLLSLLHFDLIISRFLYFSLHLSFIIVPNSSCTASKVV